MFDVRLFSGLSAFPVTPADQNGRVNGILLGQLVERLAIDGVSSIGVLGSTGGYVYLSQSQRERALHAAVEAAGEVPVLAGIGALCTRDVVANVKGAERAGAAGLLLAPVSYLPLTDRDVSSLVADIASETNLPICLYNNPGTTRFTFSESLISQLSQIAGVVAVKNPPAPDGDFAGQIQRLRETVPSGFSLGYSGDAFIDQALLAGCDAWYSVVGGTLPDIAVALWDARNDAQKLQSVNQLLAPLWETFTRYGGIRVVHEILRIKRLGIAVLPRPLLPLDEQACREIETALEAMQSIQENAA